MKRESLFTGVLNKEECDHMVDGMWNYLDMSQVCFQCPSIETIKQLEIFSRIISKTRYATSAIWDRTSQLCWDLRQNPKIIAPFEKIYQVNQRDLLVSFDGASFIEILNDLYSKENIGSIAIKVIVETI